MNVLVFLIPVSVGLGLLGLAAFAWLLAARQFEDVEGSRMRVLDERWDDAPKSGRVPKAEADQPPE